MHNLAAMINRECLLFGCNGPKTNRYSNIITTFTGVSYFADIFMQQIWGTVYATKEKRIIKVKGICSDTILLEDKKKWTNANKSIGNVT